MKIYYPGIGTREATPLRKVEKEWAEKAAALLRPYRTTPDDHWCPGALLEDIHISGERADRLEMAIAEALADAHNEGVGEGKGF